MTTSARCSTRKTITRRTTAAFWKLTAFSCHFNQYTYFRKVAAPLTPEDQKKASVLLNDSNFSFEHLRVKNLTKFAKDFR